MAEADMQLAKIQLAMGDKRKTLATYQRVFDLKPVDLRTIACIEEAFVNMVPMLLESKRFDVALEAIDYYLKTFTQSKSQAHLLLGLSGYALSMYFLVGVFQDKGVGWVNNAWNATTGLASVVVGYQMGEKMTQNSLIGAALIGAGILFLE